MNLDDKQYLQSIDQSAMLAHIDGLPEQLQRAWEHGLEQAVPESFRNVKQVVICGMGGSAIGGDLLGGLMAMDGALPVVVSRGYTLPSWAQSQETLVILSSFSGNTEETLAAYEAASARDVQILGLTTGGKLATAIKGQDGQTLWQFDHKSPPRAALGWSLGILLALAHQLSWIPKLPSEVDGAVENMMHFREEYRADVPAALNPAKRMAGQFMERFPVVYGSGVFEIVARRWKTQLNENSKVWAMYEPMPESNHNGVVGVEFPEFLMPRTITFFIRSLEYDHPRVNLRYDLTAQLLLQHGVMTDSFFAQGESLLGQMMHAIQFGDYLSYYASIANEADPTDIAPIDELKSQLAMQ